MTFKINIDTCANKLQVLQGDAASLDTCLPPCSNRDQTLPHSEPELGSLWKPVYLNKPSGTGDELGSSLVLFHGIVLLMYKSVLLLHADLLL